MVENKELPNIVIFVPDEMRGDTISLGNKHNSAIKTHNIDLLAKEGAVFTKCFTVNPVCVPSRCCTFTGQYVHSNSHRSLYQLLQPHEENLFKLLKENGYEVIWIGRNDLFDKKSIKSSVTRRIPSREGILKDNPFPKDHYLRKSFYYGKREQEEGKDTDYNIIQKALKYLDSSPNNPFCLYIALRHPHPPYNIEEPYFSMYNRNETPIPISPNFEDKPEFMQIIHERYGLDNLKKEDFREILATYYGMITRIDDHFGQLITKLKDVGLYDNSAIFFFSDHGDYAGNYGLTEKWANAFQDSLINVPLVMKIPGINPGNEIFDQLVETIDVFPTILDISQIKTPYTHFGKNLLPLLKGKKSLHRSAVFAEGGYNLRERQCFENVIKAPDLPYAGIYYDKTNLQIEKPSTVARSAMIRTNLWKLVIRDGAKEELYDLMHDPNESINLIDNSVHEQVKADLKEKLLRWYLRTSDNSDWRRQRSI
jgi:arylsulfatase A-like enzyme